MNLFFKVILLSIIIFFNIHASSQETEEEDSLYRNEFIVSGGIGFGIYSIKTNNPEDDKLTTAAGIYHLGIHYKLNQNINIGFVYNRSGFASNQDSTSRLNGYNLGLSIQYELLKNDKNSIFVGALSGTSNLKFIDHKTNSKITSSSIFIEPTMGYYHYWGKLGYFISMSYYHVTYSKLVNKDNEPLTFSKNNENNNYHLYLKGAHLKFGLLFRI